MVGPDHFLHLDEVDYALERILSADRYNDRYRVSLEDLSDLADDVEEVGAGAIHLVDESDTRDIVAGSLVPNGLRLRLHATHSAEEGDSAIEDAERTLNLDSEVDVARGVNDVDLVRLITVLPSCGNGSGGDGDTTLLLLDHPVHRRSTVMNLADLVSDTRVEEYTLGGGRLAGIDVGHDADVARIFKVRH